MPFLRSLFLLTILFLTASVNGQEKGFCGTQINHEQRAREMMRAMPGSASCNYINRVERTLQVSLFIALDFFGSTGIGQDDIDEALVRLNEDFLPCGLQFQYCKVTYMENNRFDSLDVFDHHNEEIQMTSIHYEPNTINLYLVDTIGLQGYPNVNGYAYMPGGMDVIVIEKDAYNYESDTQAHEFGHYFGLYHTFEDEYGLELVNGSNCETSGDFICDTEADGNEDGDADPDDYCNYTGAPAQDSEGNWYVPPTDNFMSYYPQDCRCRFTPMQFNRMIDQYLNYRMNLW